MFCKLKYIFFLEIQFAKTEKRNFNLPGHRWWKWCQIVRFIVTYALISEHIVLEVKMN